MERAPDPDEVRYGNSPVLNQMGKESSSEEESDSEEAKEENDPDVRKEGGVASPKSNLSQNSM